MKVRNLLFVGILVMVLSFSANLMARSSVFTLMTDMFNQVSIKPQEEGSMNAFVVGAVTVDGSENEDLNDRFKRLLKDVISKTATINPNKPDAASLADGQLKFNTYCAVCHGSTREVNKEGFAKTKVNDLGMIAPAVISLTPQFSDGYIYHKVKNGGAVMPVMGYAVNTRERWNIVNYIRELEKQE